MSETVFFSYWVGSSLPAITNLHFRSFLYHHPNSTYDLWLDEDISTLINHPDLEWIKTNERIKINYFSLNKAINKFILIRDSNKKLPQDSILRKFFRFLHRKFLFRFFKLGSINSDVIGLSYKHTSPIFQGFNDLVYRSDIARLLIPLVMYKNSKTLYVDLDICFTSNMLDLCGNVPFSYWWENGKFINSAILYIPCHDSRQKLLLIGKKIESFRPWTLYSYENCKLINMRIYSNEFFDPLWNESSLLCGNSLRFFKNNQYTDQILCEINSGNYRAIHWHNNWRTLPDSTSVFTKLLEKYSNVKN